MIAQRNERCGTLKFYEWAPRNAARICIMIIIVAVATLTTIPAEEKRVARKYKAK